MNVSSLNKRHCPSVLHLDDCQWVFRKGERKAVDFWKKNKLPEAGQNSDWRNCHYGEKPHCRASCSLLLPVTAAHQQQVTPRAASSRAAGPAAQPLAARQSWDAFPLLPAFTSLAYSDWLRNTHTNILSTRSGYHQSPRDTGTSQERSIFR